MNMFPIFLNSIHHYDLPATVGVNATCFTDGHMLSGSLAATVRHMLRLRLQEVGPQTVYERYLR